MHQLLCLITHVLILRFHSRRIDCIGLRCTNMGHEGDHDHDHGEGNAPLYSRPVQRQKWGEAQIRPHTNWGDTFFDLFYVAGAYNLGSLLKEDPSTKSFLYFLGCFFPLQTIWSQKMYYDSRFWVPDDVAHKLYEFAILILLGSAVVHIRPVATLSDTKHNVDMFAFALAIGLAILMGCGRFVDVFFNGVGQPAMKVAAKREIAWSIAIACWYFAGTLVAGLDYYSEDETHSSTDNYYSGGNESTGDKFASTEAPTVHHRVLATSTYSATADYENNLPIWLVLCGSLTFVVGLAVIVLTLPGGGKHKEVSVPMNVTFGIHRWGEFTMLMLGESVLSLLIVDVIESSSYYKTFFCGVVSIALLEFLHFRSQPHDPDDHAIRRTKEAGALFTCLMQVYSAALVVLGTSYKMLLYEHVYEASSDTGSHRVLLNNKIGGYLSRLLASSSEPMYDTDERQQRIAHFFSASMAVVWFCLDLMIINHKGIPDNLKRCQRAHLKKLSFLLIALRIGLVVFIATISQYATEPSLLAFVGLMGISAQVLLRIVGSLFFGQAFEFEASDDEALHWPNVTTPQVDKS
eukprot:Nitzschia sp. Nitz4//scaffold8_size234185//202587//204558//NITZ4_001296-RA/size234185-processed-gene-0.405-mRNA-1//-1//CDS//3329559923//7974//frame0